MKCSRIILTGLLLMMVVYPLFSGPDTEKKPLIQGTGSGTSADPFIVPKAVSAIKIDGKVEDNEWEKSLKLDLPYETFPAENTPAPVRTECYLTYDRSNLYVGFRAFDPNLKKLRAYYYDRDKIWVDDFVAVFLDTFNDERRAYGFRSNPYGVQADDIRTRTGTAPGGGTTLAFDAIYRSRGQIYDWGWSVEMAIPFNQLRFQRSKDDQVWGFNARRVYSRNWLILLDHMRVDRNNDCLMCQYVKIKGFAGANPGRNIELVPTLTATRTDERPQFPEGDFEKRNQDVEPGLTARWGISQNMTLSATLNPDFSQVEADAQQLDINEPFALSYDERRPFFYEGADYFNTYFNAVYTRTMRDPSWGFKLTGKAAGNTIGAYVVRDDITNLVFPGSYGSTTTSLDMPNTSSVFRYKRDFGINYTLGLLVTDREGENYYNRLAGIDTEIRITKKDRIQFQFLGSSTQYPGEVTGNPDLGQEEGSFGGTALDLKYSHDTRNWDFSAEYRGLTRGFRADLGFIPQVDYRLGSVSTSYTWYGKRRSWFRRLILTGAYNYSATQGGDLIRSGASLRLTYQGAHQSYVFFTAGQNREAYIGQEFDQTQFVFYGEAKPSRLFEYSLTALFGDRIDYSNGRPGQRIALVPLVVFKPGRHMRLELNHTFERLHVDSGRVYTANISQFTGIYHFNTRTFFRAILQYLNYDFNAGNYIYPIYSEYKKFATQLLFSYKINPRTVFFLGYSDNRYGTESYDLTQRNRTFFAKISYALSL